MKPRHKAAENLRPDAHRQPGAAASMKPRHKAAENEKVDGLVVGRIVELQ